MLYQLLCISDSSACLNGGTCQANDSCICSTWFTGSHCDVMIECPPGSCDLIGSHNCTVNMSTPVCECAKDYTGLYYCTSYVLHCFCHVYIYMLYLHWHVLPFGSFK